MVITKFIYFFKKNREVEEGVWTHPYCDTHNMSLI